MKLLIIYLYRSLWLSLLFWGFCIGLGISIGILSASYFNQQEKEDQLHIKQEIHESLNPQSKNE